jgi:NAD(P)-dependent dehydrogenase (short-subunit alcohol dehydrogenase family)
MSDTSALFRLDGKVALVTGAARGIGASVAAALAAAGASVLLTDILEPPGAAAAARLVGAGARAGFQRHNVTDEAEWHAAIAYAEQQFGSLDILVNNAGIETASLLTDCDVDDFRRVMEVNVTGVFLGLKHAVRAMAPGGSSGRGGAIVNLSSVAGLIGTSGHIAYHASKGAVRLMTKAAAIECAQMKTGIRVNSVHPAIIATDMGTAFVQDFVDLKLLPDYATAEAVFKAAHPMGEFGTPHDVAAAVLYLAAPAARWITGIELVIDGGYTAA